MYPSCQLLAFQLLLILSQLDSMQTVWFPWYFRRNGFDFYGMGRGFAANCGPSKAACPPGYKLKDPKKGDRLCDDNPVVLQLARLYVVSPERIVLLLSQPLMMEACEEVTDVLSHIEASTTNCKFSSDNIYAKLTNGLRYYKAEVCDGSSGCNKKRSVSLSEAHSCIRELRTDMIECEAPADWYEKRNISQVCNAYNDILDCYYIRSAMLCGLQAARQLRSFAADSMKRAMIHPCEVRKRLPKVKDPMILMGARSLKSSTFPLALAHFFANVLLVFFV